MFDFTLVHVSGVQFRGPDALSRRHPAEDEPIIPDDETWLDNIALLMTVPCTPGLGKFDFKRPTHLPYSIYTLPSVQPRLS